MGALAILGSLALFERVDRGVVVWLRAIFGV